MLVYLINFDTQCRYFAESDGNLKEEREEDSGTGMSFTNCSILQRVKSPVGAGMGSNPIHG